MIDTLLQALRGSALKYAAGLPDTLVAMATAAGLTLVVLLIEWWVVGWKPSSLARIATFSMSTRTDLLSFVLYNSKLSLVLGALMSFGLTYGLLLALKSLVGWHLTIDHPMLLAAAYYLALEFFHYWFHRWLHVVPLLWEIHKYHHSARDMTALTAFRAHPLQLALGGLWASVPLVVIGAPTSELALLHMLFRVHALLVHSNLPFNWGWVGRYLVQSPAGHRAHHSQDAAHHHTNYGNFFQFWDVLFGTALHPTRAETTAMVTGVPGTTGDERPVRYVIDIYAGTLARAGRVVAQAFGHRQKPGG